MSLSFLSQSILWGLFAASIPVIIHLLNRRRFRIVDWAATSFLLKASRESRGKKKLKHILILICRTLAIAALIFAVARPLLGGFLGSGSGSVGTVILVLDRSASMETKAESGAQSYRQAVITRVSEAVEKMGSPRLILIDSASGDIQEVPSPDALPDLSTTFATDTQADIPTLLTKAIDYIDETNPGQTEVWLASDMQRGDWRPTDSRWNAVRAGLENLPSETKLRVLSSGGKLAQNVAIELVASRRVEDNLFLDLKLTRSKGDGTSTVPITYSLKGARSAERVTMIGQELRFQKRLPLGTADIEGSGWIGIPSDNNPRDNSVFFAFGGKEPVKSWIVSEKPSGNTANYLRKAAAPDGFNRYSCEIVALTQTTKIDWSTASLIVWQAPIPTGAVAAQLQEFAASGGSIIFFPPEKPSKKIIFGTSWGVIEDAPADEYFINGSWIKDDGPWRNSLSDQKMPIDQVRGVKRCSIQGDGTSLAEWDDGTPLLYRQLEGLGTAIFINTLPDDRWSNLEFVALHLVAVQRLLEKGTDRLHAGYRAIAGSEKAKLRGDEVRDRLDAFEDYEPALGAYRAGVYRLGERVIAVNRPAAENSPLRVNGEALDTLLEGTSYSLFESTKDDDNLVSPVWWAFLITVLFFLLAEAILCLQPKLTGPPALSTSKTSPAS
ncbi:BatA domain-containing protein [Akkermansiaceae bacterium]|nr:BatA domain-containing protein [Akkermansiaceae bacterium]MDB4707987.1 BatA domain-containing protein [Akkermansiaceae bacterium]